jgi:hypothetical protein
MRQILNLETNQVEVVEDQMATDMIANGTAVPSIDPIVEKVSKAVKTAPQTAATEEAPEVK